MPDQTTINVRCGVLVIDQSKIPTTLQKTDTYIIHFAIQTSAVSRESSGPVAIPIMDSAGTPIPHAYHFDYSLDGNGKKKDFYLFVEKR